MLSFSNTLFPEVMHVLCIHMFYVYANMYRSIFVCIYLRYGLWFVLIQKELQINIYVDIFTYINIYNYTLTHAFEQNAWEEIPASEAQPADGQAAAATTKDFFGKGKGEYKRNCISI